MNSEMNGRERIFAAVLNEQPDRVPIIPIMMTRAIRNLGGQVLADRCQREPEIMAKAKMVTSQMFGGDAIIAGTDLFLSAENLGAGMEYLERAQPTLFQHPCPTKDDFERLVESKRIFNPDIGRVLNVAKEVEILVKHGFQDSHLILIPMGGPATTAQLLVGSARFITLMDQDPEFCHRVLRLATDNIKSICDVMAQAGLHAINFLDPFSSADIMPPEHFRTFSKPYITEVMKHVSGLGLAPILHICTFTSPIWEDMKETGAVALNGDFWPGIDKARQIVGEGYCLVGSVNPFTTMLKGTPEQVRTETLKCIETAGMNGAFICSPGCDLDWNVPAENIHSLIKTCQSVKYPIEPGSLGELSEIFVSGHARHFATIQRKAKHIEHPSTKILTPKNKILDQITQAVINKDEDKVLDLVDIGLKEGISAEDLVFNGLAIGMQICGERYEEHQIFVIDLMQSAKVMDTAMLLLLPLFDPEKRKARGEKSATIVIGLVRGNTQDIGKNLVSLLFTAYGFDVHDLGKNVSPELFIEAAEEKKADVIAISIMTDSSIVYVQRLIQLLTEEGKRDNYLILCGGAAMNMSLAEQLGVKYSPNANQAVELLQEHSKLSRP
ncbi:MtaA/CmuA family methyltransferase [Shewanella sp. D64]|uniref:MtaA/CmuA family methyltransferase n=1 Tax=unclassified Shewanella TaxID=196818 RepID=UPI0022BA6B2E|nr:MULTISPECIES: MtaA/CmuA family methyltransferase [unclassified Shewanella]MEC4726556.1 MtaA/CmuA family methyltransferase [Shewanella sp. D64]MEC4737403.1 MtaA/CmuA family methyltransferase [Shewanella sp. E94]WBJ97222.1 MtaA/CmuA family methyltransferase [Shewanella sp. MTB7]